MLVKNEVISAQSVLYFDREKADIVGNIESVWLVSPLLALLVAERSRIKDLSSECFKYLVFENMFQ